MLRKRATFVSALVLPYCLIVGLFLLMPAAQMIATSFRSTSPTAVAGEGFSLVNYARLADWFYFKIVWQTITLAATATLISAVLAYPVAYLIARSGRR